MNWWHVWSVMGFIGYLSLLVHMFGSKHHHHDDN